MRTVAARCQIRPMRPGDIPQVLEVERESFPKAWPRTVYQRELQSKMARYLVAYEALDDDLLTEHQAAEPEPKRGLGRLVRRFFGGLPAVEQTRDRIVGMVGLWCMVDAGHIVTIAVRRELRRQGIGELLLTAALEAALDAGQHEVTLEYRISNHAACALYEKYGFQRVGVRVRYYSDNNEDAVLMTSPPLRSAAYRDLLTQRLAEQRTRWQDDYPFAGLAEKLLQASPSG